MKPKRTRIISQKLKNNFPKLLYISEKIDPSERKRLLQKHSRKQEFCDAIIELARNCVQGYMKLGKKQKRGLQKDAHIIRELAGVT